jgi:hypothetical protein
VFDWGNSAPGTIEVSNDCDGRMGTTTRSANDVTGNWLPPVTGGVCILTARAVNSDGLATTVAAGLLVRAGTVPAIPLPPVASGVLFGTGILCTLGDATPPDCGPVQAGVTLQLNYGVSLVDNAVPGAATLTDSCAGPLPVTNFFFGNPSWTVPSTPGASCTLTLHLETLQGSSSQLAAQYQISP